MKSIYEEAIELMNLNILPRESGKTAKRKVIHALRQAQKQEKLLELYKELATVRNEIISLVSFDDEYDDKEQIEINLEKRIKELENES